MARPTYLSRTGNVDITTAHIGAGLLGLPLLPQGETVAKVLEARKGDGVRFQDVVVQMPRRSTKTTSVWATILGRAATRPGYRCVTTAQSGNVASRILIEHATAMLAAGNAVESREARSGSTLPVLFRNGGRERLEFPNRSSIWVVPPEAGAIRSAAADDIVIDEAGEHDPVKGKDFMDAVRPLQDTRGPLAQMIVAGTPGRVRAGYFWDLLEAGRNHVDKDLGIVDFSILDAEDAEDRKVWRRVHPGPASGLTPMAVLEKRFKAMGAVAFSREYLCRWPLDSTVTAIPLVDWQAREVPALALPDHFGLAADCAPDGSAAAISAAWRVDGIPHVALLAYRSGVNWVPTEVRTIARKYRLPSVVVDGIGANLPVIEALSRMRPLVPVTSPGFKNLQGACQTFVSNLPVHQAQPDMETAVGGACWREVEGGRLFGRKRSGVDISPLVSALLALWAYDSRPERQRIGITTSA
ncbi:hypothetical protein [Cellulomonas sp. SG140]|uniref:hypothetical protein n=1 Tax=Cellulomonas sp. SG140 TaxID=2976536 RepID=UPI0021E9650D|nr:hypothetical protein [Cellulomonas sp. SG140]